eukprot:SAG22_NODE_626_length_8433_cov_43.291097_5_plen_836_part_00
MHTPFSVFVMAAALLAPGAAQQPRMPSFEVSAAAMTAAEGHAYCGAQGARLAAIYTPEELVAARAAIADAGADKAITAAFSTTDGYMWPGPGYDLADPHNPAGGVLWLEQDFPLNTGQVTDNVDYRIGDHVYSLRGGTDHHNVWDCDRNDEAHRVLCRRPGRTAQPQIERPPVCDSPEVVAVAMTLLAPACNIRSVLGLAADMIAGRVQPGDEPVLELAVTCACIQVLAASAAHTEVVAETAEGCAAARPRPPAAIPGNGAGCTVGGYCSVGDCGFDHHAWEHSGGLCGYFQGTGDPDVWMDTCDCLDALVFPPGCAVEVRTEDGRQYTYDSSVLVCGYDCEHRATPGCDQVRSIRIFGTPSVDNFWDSDAIEPQPEPLVLRDAQGYHGAAAACTANGQQLATRAEMAPLQLTLGGEEVWIRDECAAADTHSTLYSAAEFGSGCNALSDEQKRFACSTAGHAPTHVTCSMWTESCPDGWQQRDDTHHCSDNDCDSSECCFQTCRDFEGTCPAGTQRRSEEDGHPCWASQEGCREDDCCIRTCAAGFNGTCPAGSMLRRPDDMHQCENDLCDEANCCIEPYWNASSCPAWVAAVRGPDGNLCENTTDPRCPIADICLEWSGAGGEFDSGCYNSTVLSPTICSDTCHAWYSACVQHIPAVLNNTKNGSEVCGCLLRDRASASTFPDGTACSDETSWPNLDHGTVCGDCTVLVNNMDTLYGGLCDNYCQSIGKQCVGAWEEADDTCAIEYIGSCSTSFGDTSDAICQCSPDNRNGSNSSDLVCCTACQDGCGGAGSSECMDAAHTASNGHDGICDCDGQCNHFPDYLGDRIQPCSRHC